MFIDMSGTLDTAPPPDSPMFAGQVAIDFGKPYPNQGDTAKTTVVQPWVTPDSHIAVSFAHTSSRDHEPEDAILEDLRVVVLNKLFGSFDIFGHAPNGTRGQYEVVWHGK